MRLAQLFQVLWARRWLQLGILGVTVGLVLALSLILPKTYIAEVSLVADIGNANPVNGTQLPLQLMGSYLVTQKEIIESHNVALKVVDQLKLAQAGEIRQQFLEATDGIGSLRDWLADALLKRLEVRLARESNVIRIAFAAPDPAFAAGLANAFADAYIQASLELKLDPARRQTEWFEGQLVGLRESLAKAQAKLADYQRNNNLVGNDNRLDVENARLVELTSQQVTAQAAMYDANTRQKQMLQALDKGQLEQLPDILGNGLLQSMKSDLGRAEGKLAEAAERYGRNHPTYLSAAAEVQSLKRKLAAELNTAKGSIDQATQIARQRAVEVQKAVDDQKSRISELRQRRDGLDVLTREVASAQLAYDTASQRTSQVRLESELNQSGVAVLNPAIEPSKPARPRLLLNLVLAVLVGTAVGAGAALTMELCDRRIRTRADIAEAGGMIVLAELPVLKTRPKRLRDSRRAQISVSRASEPQPQSA